MNRKCQNKKKKKSSLHKPKLSGAKVISTHLPKGVQRKKKFLFFSYFAYRRDSLGFSLSYSITEYYREF